MQNAFNIAMVAFALAGLVGCDADTGTGATRRDAGATRRDAGATRRDAGVAPDAGVMTDAGRDDDAAVVTLPDGGTHFRVADPTIAHYGRTNGEWGSEWWVWANEIPWTTHPLNDATGANCEQHQTRDVFFLGGTFVPEAARARACTVPAGKALFFPLYNYQADNCGVPADMTLSETQLEDLVRTNMDSVVALALDIDGVTVGSTVADFASYRSGIERFSYSVPTTDSVYQHFGYSFSGPCTPSFQAGYFVMLEPLPPGVHTVHYRVDSPGTPSPPSLDVTYVLTAL